MSDRIQEEVAPLTPPVDEKILKATLNGAFTTSASFDKFNAGYTGRPNWLEVFKASCAVDYNRFIEAVVKFFAAIRGCYEDPALDGQINELINYFT